jgi:hypothetical protein
MEYFIIIMVINIMDNIKIIKKKDMGYFIITTEINMMENTKMI